MCPGASEMDKSSEVEPQRTTDKDRRDEAYHEIRVGLSDRYCLQFLLVELPIIIHVQGKCVVDRRSHLEPSNLIVFVQVQDVEFKN